MKCLILLVVLCGAINLSEQKLTRRQIDEMLLKLLYECQAKEGATDDELDMIKSRAPPTTRGMKCVSACIGESIGLIREGRVNKESSIKMAEAAFGKDSPKIEVARMISDECGDITDPDRCESAALGYACSIKVAKNHGLDFNRDFF